jgi:hypothetical protein
MALCGAADAIIILHRKPENHWSDERTRAEFLLQVGDLCRRAARRGVMVHLQAHPHRSRWLLSTAAALEFITAGEADNLRFALHTGHLTISGEDFTAALKLAKPVLGAVLIAASGSSSCRDMFNQPYDTHDASSGDAVSQASTAGSGIDLSPLFGKVGEYAMAPIILDGTYSSWDEEYRAVRAIEELSAHSQAAIHNP